MDLKALGITKEDLIDRIVTNAVKKVFDEQAFGDRIDTDMKRRVDQAVERIATNIIDKHVAAAIGSDFKKVVSEMVFQKTNQWGEPKGEGMSLKEMTIARMDAWLNEGLDYNGRPKSGSDYSWKASTTRLGKAIDDYFHYHMDTAMKAILSEANNKHVDGIKTVVGIKLDEIKKTLKVEVKS